MKNTGMVRAAKATAIAAAVLGVTGTGVARATPSSGSTSVVINRGLVSDDTKIYTKAIKLKTKGPFEIITQTVTFEPGGTSGWHTHPGPVFVTVKSGSVTVYDRKCEPRVYTAGQGFLEGPRPAVVRNEGTVVSENVATLLVPEGTAARADSPSLCPGIQ